MNCYTYMVQCSDGTLYTGWTNDLKKRLEKHNAGKGATKSEAMKREAQIKKLSRKQKLLFIINP